jgi:hypothetical protein
VWWCPVGVTDRLEFWGGHLGGRYGSRDLHADDSSSVVDGHEN